MLEFYGSVCNECGEGEHHAPWDQIKMILNTGLCPQVKITPEMSDLQVQLYSVL